MFYISCAIFLLFVIVSALKSGVPCYFILVFISTCSFHTHYDEYETRSILQNYNLFFQISIARSVNTSFVNIAFCCCILFLRSGLTRRFEEQSNQKTNRCRNSGNAETQCPPPLSAGGSEKFAVLAKRVGNCTL